LTYSSGGVGGSTHLAGELFKLLAKVDMVHVPYKGGSPAVTDLVGGQVTMTFANLTTVIPFAKAGRLRALAVTSASDLRRCPTCRRWQKREFRVSRLLLERPARAGWYSQGDRCKIECRHRQSPENARNARQARCQCAGADCRFVRRVRSAHRGRNRALGQSRKKLQD